MRKSKAESAKTRERIVAAAAEEFREHGIVGTGLADLMATAGLTHGGFYKHFKSKDELVCEVAKNVLARANDRLSEKAQNSPDGVSLDSIVTSYLCENHRDNPRIGCVFATLGCELARADDSTRSAVTDEIQRFIKLLADQTDGLTPAEARKRATAAVSSMVGAMVLARISADPKLATLILTDAKEVILRTLGGDKPKPRSRK